MNITINHITYNVNTENELMEFIFNYCTDRSCDEFLLSYRTLSHMIINQCQNA
jgi:hypothetical protein